MTKRHDPDVLGMAREELLRSIEGLWRRTRELRDAASVSERWEAFLELCLALPEEREPDPTIEKDPAVLLTHCRQYLRRECAVRQIGALRKRRRRKPPAIESLSLGALRKEFMGLRRAIRAVRVEGSDEMCCWISLAQLYLMLPERRLPPEIRLSKNPEMLLGNCIRYWSCEGELATAASKAKRKCLR